MMFRMCCDESCSIRYSGVGVGVSAWGMSRIILSFAECSTCPVGYTCCEQGLCSGQFPAGSTGISPMQPATQHSDQWYGCQNHKRTDCSNTGASFLASKLSNDKADLEFEQCHCGAGPSPKNFVDTVSKGYFWFRDHCYQASLSMADDTSRGVSPPDDRETPSKRAH